MLIPKIFLSKNLACILRVFGYRRTRSYKKENNKPLALRISFRNSSDFIGWYFWKTNKINKVSLNDTRNMYLNYYLGWQAYKNKAYQNDKKAIIFAKSVEKQAKIYKSQLQECKSVLNKSYIIF